MHSNPRQQPSADKTENKKTITIGTGTGMETTVYNMKRVKISKWLSPNPESADGADFRTLTTTSTFRAPAEYVRECGLSVMSRDDTIRREIVMEFNSPVDYVRRGGISETPPTS